MMKNLVETYSECRGKYVALLEGDDYWTDPDKLQIQFDAMEKHSDWALCFHRARYVSHDSSQVLGRGFDDIPPETTLDDLLEKYYITTLSILFRRELIDRFPPWYVSLPMGDWPLTILLARHGKIGYLERTMGDYRIHPGGMYSGASMRQRLNADATMYRHIRPILDRERASTVTRHIIRLSTSVIACDVAARDYAAARREVLALYRTERLLPVTVSLLRGAVRRLTRPLVHKARMLMPRSLQRAVEGRTR